METQEIYNHVNQIGEAIEVNGNTNLVFWMLITFNLIVFAIVKTINRRHIRTLFELVLYNREVINNIREDLNFGKLSTILLNLTYFNALAYIVWRIIESKNDSFILLFSVLFSVAFLVKIMVIRIIIFFSNTNIGLQEHLLYHLIFFQIGGVILTPILFFTYFIPDRYSHFLTIFLLILALLFIIIRELKSIIRALQYKISLFYIILYLCTLELLPLLVGFRVFILNN